MLKDKVYFHKGMFIFVPEMELRYKIRSACVCALAIVLVSAGYKLKEDAQPDRGEAHSAFLLLNKIRQSPSQYGILYKINLQGITPKPELVWNDTLAKIAETKALDMANRNYFGHIDPDGYGMDYFINKAGYTLDSSWLTDKSMNYFESLAAGLGSGEDAIKDLIVDAGFANMSGWEQYGHRKHLLSLTDFDKGEKDIGIGFVRCPIGCSFKSYMCVIIAKHTY